MDSFPAYHVNIHVPVTFNRFEVANPFHEERLCDITKINKEFYDWLRTMQLGVAACRFFTSMPHQRYNLHVDGNEGVNSGYPSAKINMVFNSYDTTMTWYKPLPGKEGGNSKVNTVNTYIRQWDKDECTEELTVGVNSSCLIDGSQVHDLANGPNKGQVRECYTMVLKDVNTNERVTWATAVQRLAPYFII